MIETGIAGSPGILRIPARFRIGLCSDRYRKITFLRIIIYVVRVRIHVQTGTLDGVRTIVINLIPTKACWLQRVLLIDRLDISVPVYNRRAWGETRLRVSAEY